MTSKMEYRRSLHQSIFSLLKQFNSGYRCKNRILFGGGTRIALELDEYRESVDIDFLCVDSYSCRAVRTQVTANSLGHLMPGESGQYLARDERADRDAVRTFIRAPESGRPIKLEFVHFDHYDLSAQSESTFPVPCLDHDSCYLTKLLSNADRWSDPNKKDIIDLIVMHHHWGDIPKSVLNKADERYGYSVVYEALMRATEALIERYDDTLERMSTNLKMAHQHSKDVLDKHLPSFLNSLPRRI